MISKSFLALIVAGACTACSPSQLGGGTAGTTGTIATGSGGAAGGGPPIGGTLTEWPIGFADSMPFQIAARQEKVFYLTKDVGMHIGRLDIATSTFAEWPTPYTTTSPGDIQIRDSDGVVFVAAGTLGEIGQFDDATGTLTRWTLPTAPGAEPTQGPWSLAPDAGKAVYFEADDDRGSYIGRLDTVTGDLRTWHFAGATACRVLVAPDGMVLFNTWNNSGPYAIVQLDPQTGIFTSWPLTMQPLFPMVVAPDGSVFFEEGSSDFAGIARLELTTGRLTEWRTDGVPSDSLTLRDGRLYFGMDGNVWLTALNTAYPGDRESTIDPIVSASGAPDSFRVSPVPLALPPQFNSRTAATRAIEPQYPPRGFTQWLLNTPPRMTASIPGALYFTEDAYGTIARLTR